MQDRGDQLFERVMRRGSRLVLLRFRVPDRGSGNPTPLGGWDRDASGVNWLDGSVQAWQPYRLGLQVSLGLGDQVPLSGSRWRCRRPMPGIAARDGTRTRNGDSRWVGQSRSCSYADVHSAEPIGVARRATSEGTQFT